MASYHTRSFSFPSNSHPVVDQLNEELCRLRSSQGASTSSMTNKLTGLKDLYKCVDEFLQLPQSQIKTGLDEVLDGSLRLIDICSTSLDVLVQSKERLLDIQSVLRRRCNGGLNFTNEFSEYIKTRKIVKKVVKKCLKDIQEVAKINEANATESKLKDVQLVTVDALKSLLSYIGGSQKSNWSFSKLVHANKAQKETKSISAFDAIDSTVELSQLIKLESEIQVIEQDLEWLFRHLVKTRATLLNVVSN